MKSEFQDDVNEVASMSRAWLVFSGIVFVILGVLAYMAPVSSTVGIMYLLASLLVASGAVTLIQTFTHLGKPHNAMRGLRSIVSIAAGVLMFRYPGGGMMVVALSLSFYFFMSASIQWIVASAMPVGKGLGFFSSILSFFLGLFTLLSFPVSALWVPGLLLGIDLVFFGINLFSLAAAIPKFHETPTHSQSHAPA